MEKPGDQMLASIRSAVHRGDDQPPQTVVTHPEHTWHRAGGDEYYTEIKQTIHSVRVGSLVFKHKQLFTVFLPNEWWITCSLTVIKINMPTEASSSLHRAWSITFLILFEKNIWSNAMMDLCRRPKKNIFVENFVQKHLGVFLKKNKRETVLKRKCIPRLKHWWELSPVSLILLWSQKHCRQCWRFGQWQTQTPQTVLRVLCVGSKNTMDSPDSCWTHYELTKVQTAEKWNKTLSTAEFLLSAETWTFSTVKPKSLQIVQKVLSLAVTNTAYSPLSLVTPRSKK